MNSAHKTNGIGGWLLLLVLILGIIGPVAGFGRLVDTFASAESHFPTLVELSSWHLYKQTLWLIFAGSIGATISASYRLWKIPTKDTVYFTVKVLWIVPLLSFLADLIASVLILEGVRVREVLSSTVGGLIGTLIMSGVWTLYLLRSERVRTAYNLPIRGEGWSERRNSPTSFTLTQMGRLKALPREAKLHIYWSCIWISAVFCYYTVFSEDEVFGRYGFSDEEWISMFSQMFVPPLLIGIARLAYQRLLK